MTQHLNPPTGGFVALAEQLERLAAKPLQPRRRELRKLAARFRAIREAELARREP